MVSDTVPSPDEPDFDWSWTQDADDWVPPAIDLSKPSVARAYDYALGGKDNFAVDRAAAERLAERLPNFRRSAQANRAFLVRAVRLMAEQGVRQFIDLGSGIPTSPNVHEVARGLDQRATVLYVDNDPIVIAHCRALAADSPGILSLLHDVRQPKALLDHPLVRRLIDFDQPVGLLVVALMHFIQHDVAPEMMMLYGRELAPGSFLALSALSSEGMDPEALRVLEAVYPTTSPVVIRSAAQVEALFEGFTLVEPGLVDAANWRHDGEAEQPRILAAVGRKD